MRAPRLLTALCFAALLAAPAAADGFSLSPGAQALYASTCPAVVNSATPTSCFCPIGTDAQSVAKRTYPAASMTPGKAFRLDGGGTYVTPATNTLSADIAIKVGTATVMSVTTPVAPATLSPQGVDFHAICTVRAATTIACQGMFAFVVLGGTYAPVAFSQTGTFDPAVANLIDVLGDWNGTTSSHATTVTQAVLTALN